MENNQNDYHVSFFKPVSLRARKNRNMTLWLVIVWAVAIFGFQILLKVIGKPTPEQAHIEYMQVWEQVKSGDAQEQELKIFAQSVLQVLAKVYIKPEHKSALENAFSWSVFQLPEDENREQLLSNVQNFERITVESSNILDPAYLELKKILENNIATLLEISANDARRVAIPFSVKSTEIEQYSNENMEITAIAMDMYLIHNRSFLTDTKFLGFPFHYFYTAVFLLCLFIGLCWFYCVRTDNIEKENLMS